MELYTEAGIRNSKERSRSNWSSQTSPRKPTRGFRRECSALAQIQHDHIVPVYSTGSLPGNMSYLVLPLMTGGSLSELLADHLLSPREAATIVLAIAKGWRLPMQRDIIHRDVKPANVLFDEPGGRAKLTDFGLVRASQTQVLTQTQTDLICGTPEYMSPEQAHQPDRVDCAQRHLQSRNHSLRVSHGSAALSRSGRWTF